MPRLKIFLLSLVLFLAGVAGGAWMSTNHRAANFTAGVEQQPGQPAPRLESKRGFSSNQEMFTAIMSAVMEDEPLLQAHRLHELLDGLDSTRLALVFERALQVDDPRRRRALLDALLTRWAAIDPAGAGTAVRPYRERLKKRMGFDWRNPDAAVTAAWAQALPEEALAEAMAVPDAQWARLTAQVAMRALAGDDPARQLERLARLPVCRLRGDLVESAISAIAEKDAAAAERFLPLLSDPLVRSLMEHRILGKVTERDPAAGLARLVALAPTLSPDYAGNNLLDEVLRSAASRDLPAALATVDRLPGEFQKQALAAVLVGWCGEHPVDALKWAVANGMRIPEVNSWQRGSNRTSLLAVALERDYEKTLAWIREQPASSERDVLLGEAVRRGTQEQKMAVFADLTPAAQAEAASTLIRSSGTEVSERLVSWVKSLPSGPARATAVTRLTIRQAVNAPERIDSLLEAWPAETDRNAALLGVVNFFSGNAPQRALDFARRVSNPTARQSAMESVASTWLDKNASAARAWIASAPELSSEQKRVLLRRASEQ